MHCSRNPPCSYPFVPAAMTVLALALVLISTSALPVTAADVDTFPSGADHESVEFPPGGGVVTSVCVTLDKGHKIHDFVLVLTGMEKKGSLPSDLTLDVGGDGSEEWSRPGALDGSATVDDPRIVEALSSFISYEGSGKVNVVLELASPTEGRLNLSGLSITYNNAPVLVQALAPGGMIPAQTIIEDGFAAYAGLPLSKYFLDDDGDLLTYAITPTPGVSYIIGRVEGTALFFSSKENWHGSETMSVTATDPFGSAASASLTVTVNPTPDMPVPASFLPEDPLIQMKEGETRNFSAVVRDPDGDGVEYRWFTDGAEIPGADDSNNSFSAGYYDAGVLNVMVRIERGSEHFCHGWSVIVENVNLAPVAVIGNPREPEEGGPYLAGTSINLYAEGSFDPDGDVVCYLWSDQDGEIGSGRYCPAVLSEGNHTITLMVYDSDGAVATDSVTVAVTKTLPETEGSAEHGPLVITLVTIIFVISIGAVAAAIVLSRRRVRRFDGKISGEWGHGNERKGYGELHEARDVREVSEVNEVGEDTAESNNWGKNRNSSRSRSSGSRIPAECNREIMVDRNVRCEVCNRDFLNSANAYVCTCDSLFHIHCAVPDCPSCGADTGKGMDTVAVMAGKDGRRAMERGEGSGRTSEGWLAVESGDSGVTGGEIRPRGAGKVITTGWTSGGRDVERGVRAQASGEEKIKNTVSEWVEIGSMKSSNICIACRKMIKKGGRALRCASCAKFIHPLCCTGDMVCPHCGK